jgi:beta-glucanase (GH16 family)
MKKRLFSILVATAILITLFTFSGPTAFAAAESMFAAKTGTGYHDNAAYELGTIFRSYVAGQITAVKAFGVTGETGNHTVRIWRNSDNTVVAGPYTWNYTGNNSWLTYTLPTALNITANTDYTVTVSTGTDSGKYYSAINGDFSSAGNNGANLSWPANAGVYTSSLGTRPASTWGSSNYLRDVVFNTSAPGTPDLIVTDISWSPANPSAGSDVTFSATIRNQGTGATPAGVIHGVLFYVDGTPVSWSDTSTASLAAGATRVLTANGGPSKATWTAASGTHTVLAAVDDVNRITESNESNNTRSENLTVGTTNPLIFQEFNPWTGNTSPDGIWQKAGVWTGGFGNVFDPARAVTQSTYNGQSGGWLLLNSLANSYNGSEIQTLSSYSYGYYEVRMKPTGVSGVCNSFFWIESTSGYGPCEWDVEFFTNTGNTVHFTIHPSGRSEAVPLSFNPASDFHRYGFLWTPGKIDFTIDGVISRSFTDSSLNTDVKGYIMMNNWTTTGWLGGPPTQNTTAVYDWVKFYPGATEIIP